MNKKVDDSQSLPLDFVEYTGRFYYDNSTKDDGTVKPRQIVYAPVQFYEEEPKVIEAIRSDPYDHAKADITIRPRQPQDYRERDRLPVKGLSVRNREELLAVKSKLRPCLVLGCSAGVKHQDFHGAQQSMVKSSCGPSYFVAPIFSASNGQKQTAFVPLLTARIRHMMYREFVFIPASNGSAIDVDSIIRLDRCFWTPLNFGKPTRDLFISHRVFDVICQQLLWIAGTQPSEDFMEFRELSLEYLNDALKEQALLAASKK